MRRRITTLLLAVGLALGAVPSQAGEEPMSTARIGARVPVLEAAKRGELDAVRQLLADGADPGVRDALGRTPLHYAARLGHANIVEALVRQGADMNARDQTGHTPLIRAAQAGHADVVAFLLKNGADPAIEADGRTAEREARERGHADLLRLF